MTKLILFIVFTIFSMVGFAQQNTPEYYKNLGTYNAQKGEYDEAIKNYSKAIELDSTFSQAYNNRGIVWQKLERYKESLADFDKAIKLNSTDYAYFYNRGITEAEMDKKKDALKDYDRAVEMAPDKPEPYAKRGLLKDDLKDYAGSIKDFNKAIEISPNNSEYYIYRGISEMYTENNYNGHLDFFKAAELGNPQIKNLVLKEFLRYLPKNDTIFNLGITSSIKIYLKDYKGAIRDLNNLISLSPDNSNAYYQRGIAKLKLDKKSNGCQDLKKAVELGDKEAEKEIIRYCGK